jgi:HlyD family secretion protein
MISDPIKPTDEREVKKKFRLIRLLPWLIGFMVLLLLGGVSYAVYRQVVILPQAEAKRNQDTIPVGRQSLKVTVAANGTVQPGV